MAPIPRTWTRLRACRGAALLTASLSRACNPTPRTTSRQSQDRDKVPEHWPKPSRPHFKPGRQDLNPGEVVADRNVLSRNGLVHCDKGILLLNVDKDALSTLSASAAGQLERISCAPSAFLSPSGPTS